MLNMTHKQRKTITEKVQDAINDPEITALRKPLALLGVRLEQLLSTIDTDVSAKRWEAVIDAWKNYAMWAKPEGVAGMRAFNKLDSLMEAGELDHENWKQIFDLLDLQRKLSESETKRMKEMQLMMSAEELSVIAFALLNAVIEIEDDDEKLRQIQKEFVRQLGAGYVDPFGASRSPTIDIESSRLDTETFLDTGTERADDVGAVPDSGPPRSSQ